jgi:competence protein ComEA
VTLLKSLALNMLMLAVTVGILYWAMEQGSAPELEQTATAVRQDAAPHDAGESDAAPEVREMKTAPATASRSSRAVQFPLDLNQARLEELMELPGIGEKLAQRVVEYRKTHGGFRSVEDLRKVRGIGEKRMERLRPLVVTAGAP